MTNKETRVALLEIQASFREFNKMLDKIETNAIKKRAREFAARCMAMQDPTDV